MRYREFYESALKKHEKNQKILKRALIGVGIGAAALAVFLGLYFTSGIVTSKGGESVAYGESLESPSAFLATAYREYEVLGEWQEEMPSKPGTYETRIVSKGLFGRTTIHKGTAVTITPVEASVYVTDEEVPYGTNPSVRAELLNGDVLTSYELSYESMVLAKTKVHVDASSILITDYLGNDVTSCYSFTTPDTDITFTAVPLTLKLKDATKVYDGKPLTSDFYELDGDLPEGMSLEITTSGSQTEAGTSVNEITSVRVLMADGTENENFRISCQSATLTVTPMDVTITTEDLTSSYNGENQEFKAYTSDKEIPDNVSVNPAVCYEAGSYQNQITLSMTSNEGYSRTSSYNITYVYGVITITPISIKVSLDDVTDQYSDKTEYENLAYTVTEGSVYDTTLDIHGTAVMTSWNEGSISETSYTVYKDDKDITSSYNITFTDAKVTRTAADITLKPVSATKQYDGEYYYGTEYSVTEGAIVSGDEITITSTSDGINASEDMYSLTIQFVHILRDGEDVSERYNVTKASSTLMIYKCAIRLRPDDVTVTYGEIPSITMTVYKGELSANDELTYDDDSFGYWKAPGLNAISIIPDHFSIKSRYTDEDEIKNYDINYDYGYLTVEKITVEISLRNKNKVYDGTELMFTEDDLIVEGSILSTDKVVFTVPQDSIKDYGRKDVSLSSLYIKIQDTEFLYYKGNKDDLSIDVTEYYNIIYGGGSLSVTKRDLTFTSESVTKYYDYQPLKASGYTVSNLAEGDTIDADNTCITGSLTSVGSTPNTVESVFIICITYDDEGNPVKTDVTSNYSIKIVEGTLTYLEREVS